MSRSFLGCLLWLQLAAVPSLAAELAVTGSVTEAPGRPFAGARVALVEVASNYDAGRTRHAGGEPGEAVAVVRSDAEGRYHLGAPAPGVFKVVVEIDGKVPMQLGPLLLVEARELPPVQPGRDVGSRIRVVDGYGSPAAGALVSAAGEEPQARHATSGGWRPENRVRRTGAGGSVSLPRLEGEVLAVSVFVPGLPEKRRRGIREGATVKLPAPDPARASLSIVTPGGEPAAGVLVRIGKDACPAGVTAADGSLELALRPEPAVRAFLIAPDGWRRTVPLRGRLDGHRREIVLPASRRLTGRVLDAATRQGIAGVLLSSETDPGRWTTTDGEGRYTFPAVGQVPLFAAAPGYLPARATLLPADLTAPAILLERSSRLQGSVVGPGRRPLPGALVEAVPVAALSSRTFSPDDPVADRAVSGPDGRFEVPRLQPGREYELRVTRSGFLPRALRTVPTAPDRRPQPIEVELSAAPAVRGWISDPAGEPVLGAEVTLRPGRRPEMRPPLVEEPEPSEDDPRAKQVLSDPEGRFVIAESPAAEVDLEVEKDGYAPARLRAIDVTRGTGGTFEVGRIELQPGVALPGQVLGRRGAPVAGAEIFLLGDTPPRTLVEELLDGESPRATTGGDGRFRLSDLPSGIPQHLAVRAPGYLLSVLRAVRPPLREPLVVYLDPGAALRGRTLDEAGEPVAGAHVSLYWQAVLPDDPEGRPVGEPLMRTASSDREGRFEIAESPEGTVSLGVTARGFIPVEDFQVRVPSEDPDEELTLTLRRGARLRGRVVTTAGDPVAGARISAGEAADLSDGDGVYAVDGVATGDQELEVFHPHYPRLRTRITVELGENTFDAELKAGTEVSGWVVDLANRPVAGAEVRLTAGKKTPWREYRTRTDAGGGFSLSPVASGQYRLQARAEGLAALGGRGLLQVEGAPVEDVELVLSPLAKISGRVSGLTAEELAAVEVAGESEEGGLRHARIDAEGRYEVRDVHPGDWVVRASLWQGQRQVVARVPISSSDREVIRDLEFGRRLTLSGQVFFDDEPLADALVSVRGRRLGTERTVTSGFDGTFRLGDLAPDHYWLGVNSSRRLVVHNDELDLTADREVEIRLAAASIGGVVEDGENGEPIPGAGLTLRPSEGPEFLVTSGSKPDGTFHVFHVPPGAYRLSARAAGYAPAVREVRLAAGQELLGLALRLRRTSGLELWVHLASGGVPELVHVAALDGAGAPVLTQTVRPEPSGRVDLASLPEGSWQLLVGGAGASVVATGATVPGEAQAVTLPDAGRLHVRVGELASEELMATLRLQSADGQPFLALAPGGRLQQSWPLQGGKGTVDGLPSGSWTVRVEATDGRVWQGSVATAGGGETALSLD